MKVFIVNFDQTLPNTVSELIRGWGYNAIEVFSETEVYTALDDEPEPAILLLNKVKGKLNQNLKALKSSQLLYVIMLAEYGPEKGSLGWEEVADDFVVKPIKPEELRSRLAVGRRTLQYAYDLAKLTHEMTLKEQQISQLKTVDILTGISNRHYFEERLSDEWRRASREGNQISLLMLDIDFFKEYNETYGHTAGDECLRQVGRILSASIGRGGDLVARYGGEEFVVMLPNTDKLGTLVIAEAVRVAVAKLQIEHSSSSIYGYVTVSVGTTTMIPQDGDGPEVLIAAADKAMYQAKCSGRNTVRQTA